MPALTITEFPFGLVAQRAIAPRDALRVPSVFRPCASVLKPLISFRGVPQTPRVPWPMTRSLAPAIAYPRSTRVGPSRHGLQLVGGLNPACCASIQLL